MASTKDSEPNREQQLAARRAAEQDVLLREVDEAVRKEEMLRAARRYGWAAAGGVVLLIAGLGGWLLWDRHSEGQLEERSEKLVGAYDALQIGDVATSETELKALAADGGSAAAASAKLALAATALGQNRPADALKFYGEVAGDADAPQPYRDLALIRQVAAQFEDMPPQQIVDRLKPLAVKGNPWFGSAGELVAMAYLKQGREELAGPLLAEIAKDETVPDTLRSRTRQLAGLLGYDAVVDAAQTLDQVRQEAGAVAAPGPAR
ncbi:MAG: hypothetical protein B7Z08_11920 [Sphingomonadales bacterium 32-68-7]|nr:MAG: hypothetical protein B7Z33_12630 [Sphingomonadales bacterium 12-68-11]OYX07701.1 MAG: hypothetical protein B7Z08_11920 [Sphingomonadales bacterium 32-68-7]